MNGARVCGVLGGWGQPACEGPKPRHTTVNSCMKRLCANHMTMQADQCRAWVVSLLRCHAASMLSCT